MDYATELVADARSPLAYAIPAALFTIGFFYVVGCLFMLHLDGGNPSFRTFIGGIPMLTSMNMAAQLRRVAGLKRKLQEHSGAGARVAPTSSPPVASGLDCRVSFGCVWRSDLVLPQQQLATDWRDPYG